MLTRPWTYSLCRIALPQGDAGIGTGHIDMDLMPDGLIELLTSSLEGVPDPRYVFGPLARQGLCTDGFICRQVSLQIARVSCSDPCPVRQTLWSTYQQQHPHHRSDVIWYTGPCKRP